MRATAIWLSALVLSLVSCNSDRNLIAIETKNFDEEIDINQNLEFSLNKHVFNDSLFDHWIDAPLVTFDPPVKGRFKITSSDKFYFSPLEGFAESEVYKATLDKSLYDLTDAPHALKSASVEFHTPLLAVSSANTYWYREDATGEVRLHADLNFTATVDPHSVAALLTAKADDKELGVQMSTGQPSKSLSLTLGQLKPDKKKIKVAMSIRPGLSSPGSVYATKNALKADLEIPEVEDLEIRDCTAQHDGLLGTITVITNQQISNSNISTLVQVQPSVVLNVEKTTNGLVITSEQFDPATTYTLILSDQLLGVAGGKMTDTYQQPITFGELEPMVEFVDDNARYLSGKGQRNLAFRIVNVPKVKVEVVKIYENNILAFLRDGFQWDWYESYDEEDGWDYHDFRNVQTEIYGNVVYTKEYEISKLEKFNASRVLNLDVRDKMDKFDGIYVVKVSSTDKQWLSDIQVVSVSDIGLIAKASADEVVIYANSLQSAEPMSGIKVSFISTNNQKLYTGTTDKNGIARFSNLKKEIPDFNISLITAKNGADYTYLPFSETEVATSRFDVGGKRLNGTDIDAFLYPERNLYRPGETMHIAGVLRSYDWKLPEKIPVKLKIISPSGKEFKTVRKTLDDQGAFDVAIEIPAAAITGTYGAELYTSNDVLIAAQYISVEEFMPDRITVKSSLNKKEYYPGDDIRLDIKADNLYGTPAANRNWEAEMNIRQSTFSSKKFPDYYFGLSGAGNYLAGLNSEGTTTDEGAADAHFLISPEYKNIGILQGNILSTVFDESGRPVYSAQDFKVITQQTLIGIGRADYYVKTKQAVKFPLIAVDKDDKGAKSVTAKVVVIKHEYETVIERNRNYYTYRSNRKEKILNTYNQNISGTGTAIWVTPQLSGEYEVRVFMPDATSYVSRHFYAYGWGSTQNNSFEVSKEGNVDIIADKEQYKTGETADLLFTTPFNGKLLVTVERDKVYENYYLTTEKKSATLSLKLLDAHVPNVYITATLFKPNDDSGLPLTVAHGIINLKVDNPSKEIPLTVTHEDKSRSNKKQTIQIKTAPNAELTVAVVDEGILQIKGFQTPDPYKWFYMERALSVMSYDLYAYLYPEIYLKKLLSGGDAMMTEGRTNPMTAKRVKLVSFWSGIIKADASGRASYTVDIPQFSGDLRVMVAAYKNDQFGANESHIKVADPIVVTTSLPRFLTPGDTISIPVTMANTTAKQAGGKVSISAEGPLKIAGANSMDFNAGSNKESRVVFKLIATGATGNGSIKVQVNALNETFTDVTEIGVRPPASLQKYNGAGVIEAGKQSTIAITNNFVQSSAKAKLVVSTNPLVQFAEDLEYLIQYPHGCVEQITSSVFPQLYYADLVKTIYGKENKDINPNYNVQEGIRILESMQMHNGALSYWPGGGYESWWGTIYACHFLTEAKKAGFDVNDKTLNMMYGYLKTMLKQKKTFVYYYNSTYSREIAAKDVCYSLYVLALAGKAEVSTMNYYKANLSMLALDSKYLLAMAYTLNGDKKSASKVLPDAFSGEESTAVFSGSFYSPIRDRAIALNCLLEADPENQQIGRLAQQLSEMMKNQRYLNTQERSFAFLAFGKLAAKNKNADVKATVKANGKTIGTYEGKDLVITDASLIQKEISIATTGTGRLYYFWNTQGVTADGSFVQEDASMRVRKTLLDRWGHPIDMMHIKQNDLVVVRITIQSDKAYLENVAITDILPAGFEIENDRLRGTNSLPWIQGHSSAEYEDIRDDRISLYTNVGTSLQTYYYICRAVSPGTFRMGPVMADAMYQEAYHSYNGAGWVRIIQ